MKMIAIEGNIGAGKSTLLEAIAGWFPPDAVVAPEPIGVWTAQLPGLGESALGKFYSDPGRNALAFQVFVASSKVRDLREKMSERSAPAPIPERPDGAPGTGARSCPRSCPMSGGSRGARSGAQCSAESADTVFCERDPFDADIFPRLNFEEGHFDEYQLVVMRHLLETLGDASGVPRVTASIYLRADPALCLERVSSRGRAEEGGGGVCLGRLRMIHRLHEDKFAPPSGGSWSPRPPVLVLDASAPVESHREAVREFVAGLSRP
jgi:deoxyadenosine/deoxycytidine kinase